MVTDQAGVIMNGALSAMATALAAAINGLEIALASLGPPTSAPDDTFSLYTESGFAGYGRITVGAPPTVGVGDDGEIILTFPLVSFIAGAVVGPFEAISHVLLLTAGTDDPLFLVVKLATPVTMNHVGETFSGTLNWDLTNNVGSFAQTSP